MKYDLVIELIAKYKAEGWDLTNIKCFEFKMGTLRKMTESLKLRPGSLRKIDDNFFLKDERGIEARVSIDNIDGTLKFKRFYDYHSVFDLEIDINPTIKAVVADEDSVRYIFEYSEGAAKISYYDADAVRALSECDVTTLVSMDDYIPTKTSLEYYGLLPDSEIDIDFESDDEAVCTCLDFLESPKNVVDSYRLKKTM